jgi:hypothetical protein
MTFDKNIDKLHTLSLAKFIRMHPLAIVQENGSRPHDFEKLGSLRLVKPLLKHLFNL